MLTQTIPAPTVRWWFTIRESDSKLNGTMAVIHYPLSPCHVDL